MRTVSQGHRVSRDLRERGNGVLHRDAGTGAGREGKLTVYARIHCASGPACMQGRETVAVSNPSCEHGERPKALKPSQYREDPAHSGKCEANGMQSGPTPQAATFQGASADGSKVFFTTNSSC